MSGKGRGGVRAHEGALTWNTASSEPRTGGIPERRRTPMLACRGGRCYNHATPNTRKKRPLQM